MNLLLKESSNASLSQLVEPMTSRKGKNGGQDDKQEPQIEDLDSTSLKRSLERVESIKDLHTHMGLAKASGKDEENTNLPKIKSHYKTED